MGGNGITFVRPFPLYLSNGLTVDLDLLRVSGSLPWLTGN